jgi:hypothetical protein
MGQFEFFDADKRLAKLGAKGEREAVDRLVPSESFAPTSRLWCRHPEEVRINNICWSVSVFLRKIGISTCAAWQGGKGWQGA